MNMENKNSKFITILVIGIFIVLSYALVKNFFGDTRTNKNAFSKNGSFNFIYNKVDDKSLDEKYDEKRTYRVIINKNYGKITNDIKRDKLSVNPAKIDYVFSNGAEDPKSYKIGIKNGTWFNVYKIDAINNKLSFVILGSDLKYYTADINIITTPEGADLKDSSWVEMNKSSDLSIYVNKFYKVIDEVCAIELKLPEVLNDDKITKALYEELKDKVMKSISIEDIPNIEYNYAVMDKNVKLSNNITLLLKNAKIYQYASVNDTNNNISYTGLFILNDKNELVGIYEIDSMDDYSNYLSTINLHVKEYTYKDIKCNLYYTDEDIKSNGIAYEFIILEIDGKYYSVIPYSVHETTSDSEIDNWISNLIKDIITIK